MSTLFVQIGSENVACQTFVANQCRGLLANAVLTSPTSLVPMLDLELQVEFRCERGGLAHREPAALSSSQLAGRQAFVDGRAAALSAPHRHLDGDLAAGRSAVGPAAQCAAFRSVIFIARCAFPIRASWSRPRPAAVLCG